MAKATKTWKLGEVAQGGVITVEIQGKIITIIGKEWDMSAGCRKSSNQSNAKEFTRGTVASTDSNSYRLISKYLEELTTHYWASTIIEWIESKVKLSSECDW